MDSKESNSKRHVKKYKPAPANDWLAGVKGEFKKITWTSREELVVYTKIVVATTFLFGMGIYLVDVAIQFGIDLVGNVFKWIFG